MKSLNEQAADNLESAGAVLWLPEWWTTGAEARDSDGEPIFPSFPDACSFCAYGALKAAHKGSVHALMQAIFALEDSGGRNYVEFNDTAKSNKDVAIAMFRAADKLRGTA